MTLVKVIVVGPTAIMSFAMVLVTAIVISMAAAIKGTGIMENKKNAIPQRTTLLFRNKIQGGVKIKIFAVGSNPD